MKTLDRRSFFQILLPAGTVLVAAGCGGSENTQTPEPVADDSFSCMDESGLEAADVSLRASLNYVDASPVEDKNCLNCILYQAPAQGSGCGTCITVKGPIHPEGYCDIWAEKPA